ncbi:hypothetical protein [Specibacter sp. RAF43]|uniref:hypothetical protein n=1 Tax=Specibacter sp. RAF43 TaxID=3233057 RepID=UPI003F97CAB3
MSEEPNVVHIKDDTITPAMRTGLALLLGSAVVIFGLVGQFFGLLEAVVSVAVVACFHMATHWSAPAPATREQHSRLAGTLSQAKADIPALAVFLDRGSRLVELGKGVGKGLSFLVAKSVFTWFYSLILTPVNILDRPLPWLALAFLAIGAAMAWNFDGFKALLAPLVKVRQPATHSAPKDNPDA